MQLRLSSDGIEVKEDDQLKLDMVEQQFSPDPCQRFIVQFQSSGGTWLRKMTQLQLKEVISKPYLTRDFQKTFTRITQDVHQSQCSTFNVINVKYVCLPEDMGK